MKLIKYAIKIYKESKRNINSKKVIYTEKKISKTEKFFDINKLEIRNKNKITFNRNNIIDNINITRSDQSIIKNIAHKILLIKLKRLMLLHLVI